jgi:hypothetical protein
MTTYTVKKKLATISQGQRLKVDAARPDGGEAQLIRYPNGKTELRGGSKQDRAEAKEWMSLFWHEAVVGDNRGRRV